MLLGAGGVLVGFLSYDSRGKRHERKSPKAIGG
jgi:hypothetical protein